MSDPLILSSRRRARGFVLCLALLGAVPVLAAEPVAAPAVTVDAHAFTLELLLDPDPHVALFGAKAIAHADASRDELDLVAELLAARAQAPRTTPADLDLTSWLINALGASADARYRATIEQAVAAYANAKVSKYGALALAKLPATTEAAYVPGSLSLDAIRSRLAARHTAPASATELWTVAPGTPVEAMFAALGPADAHVESIDSKRYVQVRISRRTLDVVYFGRGLVSLDDRGDGWVVAETWPEIANGAPPYAGAHPLDAALVMTSDPSTLAALSERLLDRKETEPALLDRVMERLTRSARTRDEAEALAMRNFCRLLGRSGIKRYHDPLRSVARAAGEGDIHELALAASAKLD
jgi:hypothetical protein